MSSYGLWVFVPVIDYTFLTDRASVILASGQINGVCRSSPAPSSVIAMLKFILSHSNRLWRSIIMMKVRENCWRGEDRFLKVQF